MADQKNRREFTRAQVRIRVETQNDKKKTYKGTCRNISAKGLFFECPEVAEAEIGSNCRVSIRLHEDIEEAAIRGTGKIVRIEENGAAVEFQQIELEGFYHLQNLIRYNTDQVMQVEDEFNGHLGLRPKGPDREQK